MSAFSAVLDGLRPVFVVGHPRSGTTLVQQLLSAHSAFWSAPETHLYTYVLTPIANWQDRPLRPNDLTIVFKRLKGKPGIALSDAAKAGILAESERGLLGGARLLDLIMRAHKPDDSVATRWLEKTPRHVYCLDLILRYFPDARVVHVLRDPRGVASSPTRFGELSPGPERSALVVERGDSWNAVVDLTDKLAGEPRLMTVRYEDIVADRDTALRRVMAHVGVEFDATVLERFGDTYSQVTIANESVRKQLNTVNEIVDRRAVYQERMTVEEIALVDGICGERMWRKGYVPDGNPQPRLVEAVRAQMRPRTPERAASPPNRLSRLLRAVERRVKRRLGLR